MPTSGPVKVIRSDGTTKMFEPYTVEEMIEIEKTYRWNGTIRNIERVSTKQNYRKSKAQIKLREIQDADVQGNV